MNHVTSHLVTVTMKEACQVGTILAAILVAVHQKKNMLKKLVGEIYRCIKCINYK